MARKDYTPVPLVSTDHRIFYCKFNSRNLVVQTEFTQLDLLQMATYIKGKNERLHSQIIRFIQACDQQQGEKTDFTRKIPRRRVNGIV